MAKVDRKSKKHLQEKQWARGLRVKVCQGTNISEIWQCENDVWATYYGPRESHKPKYMTSFSQCIDHILTLATNEGVKLEGLKKSLIRETELAIRRSHLPTEILQKESAEVNMDEFEQAKLMHEGAKAGRIDRLSKKETSDNQGKCGCC